MEPMNIAVMCAGALLIIASIVFIVLDMRKRNRKKHVATQAENNTRYESVLNDTMVAVATMLFTYMAKTAMTLPNRTGRHIDEHEAALMPIQYEYEYKGKWPFALRTTNTAVFKFAELGMEIRRTASICDVLLEISVPEQNFKWASLVGDTHSLLVSLHNFEKLMAKKETPPDLSELLPRDPKWLCRLAHVSSDHVKWDLMEAYQPGSSVALEDLQTFVDHLRLLHVDLKQTLMTS